jgi:transposase
MTGLSAANVDITYNFKSVCDSFRIYEKYKSKLLEYFVLGVPIYRLRFITKVCDETIKKFFRVIRKLLSIEEECIEPFTVVIECEETTFGAKRHRKRGWVAAGKIIVFGILKRDGQIRVSPIAERKKDIVQELIQHYTKPGPLIILMTAPQFVGLYLAVS